MKKLFLLLAFSLVLLSCSDGYVIKGTVKGIADGTKVKLERQQETLGFVIATDTAIIKDGQFTFKGKSPEPTIYQISIDSVRGKSPIVVENADITIAIDTENILLNKVAGTYHNEQLTQYSASMDKVQRKVKEFQNANDPLMKQAKKTRDTATIKKLIDQNKKIKEQVRDEIIALQEQYSDAHPKSFISLIMIQGSMAYPNANISEIKTRFDNLDPSLKNSTIGKGVAKKLEELKIVNVGRHAPNFSAPDQNGKLVALNEAVGQVTIIDFWASWCPPCRKENPNMVALYKEFHGKGLNIIGVSLDKDAERWKEAIAKDGLAWTQVSNLKYWEDPIAQLYGVQALPATYVLNHYGVVVAKDLSGEALRKKVASLLEKKTAMRPDAMMKLPPPVPKK